MDDRIVPCFENFSGPRTVDSAKVLAVELTKRRAGMSVSRHDARLTLISAGLWDAVVAYFSDPKRHATEVDFFEDVQTWRRLDFRVRLMGKAIGVSEEQVDELFVSANAISDSTHSPW